MRLVVQFRFKGLLWSNVCCISRNCHGQALNKHLLVLSCRKGEICWSVLWRSKLRITFDKMLFKKIAIYLENKVTRGCWEEEQAWDEQHLSSRDKSSSGFTECWINWLWSLSHMGNSVYRGFLSRECGDGIRDGMEPIVHQRKLQQK